jgi:hypothetical protein
MKAAPSAADVIETMRKGRYLLFGHHERFGFQNGLLHPRHATSSAQDFRECGSKTTFGTGM